MEQSELVLCGDMYGQLVGVPRSEVAFRPAAYGLLIENGRVLLQKHPTTDLLHPPGGMVLAEETISETLRQHFRAATGITPQLGALLMVEQAWRVDRSQQGWSLGVMYYELERPSSGRASVVNFENPARPNWYAIADVAREQMQFGFEAFELAARLAG